VIVRHQRASSSHRGFRQLARYIRGRSAKPRTTWFLAANLPGVTTTDDLELACRLVEAVHAQNTRAGGDRIYHMVISLHPEDRSLDRKEWRHVVENLVDALGFSDHQYIAARHGGRISMGYGRCLQRQRASHPDNCVRGRLLGYLQSNRSCMESVYGVLFLYECCSGCGNS
jgi:hypothetical protein